MWETTPQVPACRLWPTRDATALDLQFQRGRGDSLLDSSRIWFTLSHGILNEIYYPTIDRPQTRDMQFLITDGKTFFHEEKRDLDSTISYIQEHTLGYHIESADREGRYRLQRNNRRSSPAVRAPACADGSGS